MTIYEKNYEKMKYYCSPFDIVEDGEVASNVFETESGIVTSLTSNNYEYRLCSIYRNQELAVNLVESMMPLDDYGVYVVYGMGNIDYIRTLVRRKKDTAYVIVIEPNKGLFTKIMYEVDLVDVISQKYVFFFCPEINWNAHEKFFSYFCDGTRRNHVFFIAMMNYKRIYGEELEEIRARYEKSVDFHEMVVNTNIGKRGRFAKCSISNIKQYIYESDIDNLIDGLLVADVKRTTAILVASGPSLKEDVEELKKANGKAFIMAVDNSIQYLYDHGIKPNLGIIIDTDKGMGNLCGEDVINTPMICSDYATEDFTKIHKARKFFEIELSAKVYEAILGRTSNRILVSGGTTVANPALMFLLDAGFENIILVGNDLGYPNGEVHVQKNMYGTDSKILSNAFYTVDANDGGMVSTSPDMDCARTIMEQCIKSTMEKRPVNVVNCSKQGAKISRAEYMAVSEAIDKYCKENVNFDEVIEKIPRKYADENKKKEAEKQLRRMPKMADELGKEAFKLKSKYEKLLDAYSSGEMPESEIEKELKDIQPIINGMEDNALMVWANSYSSYQDIFKVDIYDGEMTGEEVLKFGIHMCEVYSESVKEMVSDMEKILC